MFKSRIVTFLLTATILIAPASAPQADDAARIFGTFVGEALRSQQRQQQLQQQQRLQQQQLQRQQQRQIQRQQERQQSTQQRQRQAQPAPQQPRMSMSQRMAVQRALASMGYYRGEIDGMIGPGSRKAIAAWQAGAGAATTGYLLPGQVRTLTAMAAAAAPAPLPVPAPQPDWTALADQFADDRAWRQDDPAAFAGTDDGMGWRPAGEAGSEAADWRQPETATAEAAAATLLPWQVPPQQAATLAAEAPSGAGDRGQPQGDVLVGDEAIAARLLLWTVAREPDLLRHDVIADRVRRTGFVPGIERQRDPTQRREAMLPVVAPYADRPPRAVVFEHRAYYRPAYDGAPERLDMTIAPSADIPAITDLTIHAAGASASDRWTFAADRPFFMPIPQPIPPGWAVARDENAELITQIEAVLTDLRPNVSREYLNYRGGVGALQVTRVTLLKRHKPARRDDPQQPDVVLHRWTGEAPEDGGLPAPDSATAIARLYGGGALGDRYAPRHDTTTRAAGTDQPPLLPWDGSSELLGTAMRLRAAIEAGPDRPLDADLAQTVMRQLLSERERLALFPPNIARQNSAEPPTEIEMRTALTRADADLRRIAVQRAPALPLPMRDVHTVSLGEYDFDRGRFPMDYNLSALERLPLAAGMGRAGTRIPPLEMQPEIAQQFLDHLKRRSGGTGNRGLSLAVDYTLAALASPATRSGPITARELGAMTGRSHVDAITLFTDATLTEKLRDIPVPEALQAGRDDSADSLPTEIFATTAGSLIGAMARLDPDRVVAEYLIHHRGLRGRDDEERRENALALRDRLMAEARDGYWIGADMNLDAYDPARQGFPVKRLSLQAVGHPHDISGFEVPHVALAAGDDFDMLRVGVEEAVQIDALRQARGQLRAFLLVRPLAFGETDYGTALMLDLPTEAIFGPSDQGAFPQSVALRTPLGAPPRIGAAAPAPDAAPEALLLDAEGLDLLALSLDPAILDDDAFRRMMIDRVAKERWFAAAADDELRGPLPWGAFFTNPELPLGAEQIEALLPAFRDWTLARAGALPQTILMHAGAIPQTAPDCRGWQEATAPQLAMNGDALMAMATSATGITLRDPAQQMNVNTRLPGPDRVWMTDPGHRTGNCAYPSRRDDRGAAPPAQAGRIAGLIAIPAQPWERSEALRHVSLYRLDRQEMRIERPSEALAAERPYLRGVLVASAAVREMVGYAQEGGSRNRLKLAGRITPEDWTPGTATPPAATDILGMTLDMPLAEFEAAALAHLGADAVRFETVQPGRGLYGHATGFIAPESGEAMAAIHAPHAEGQPVTAIMRRVVLPAGAATMETLKASLSGKYGPLSRDAGEGTWFWGTLPARDDGYGFCGGEQTLQRSPGTGEAPVLEAREPGGLVQGSHYTQPGFWVGLGWPRELQERPGGFPDPAQCGPVVGVIAHQVDRGAIEMKMWLTDRKRVGELATAPPPAPPAADIKL